MGFQIMVFPVSELHQQLRNPPPKVIASPFIVHLAHGIDTCNGVWPVSICICHVHTHPPSIAAEAKGYTNLQRDSSQDGLSVHGGNITNGTPI